MRCLWPSLRPRTAPFSCGQPFPSSRRLCGSSVRGASPINPLRSSGSKRTKGRIAGFMGWASGRGRTPRSACWRPRDIRSGRPPTFTSLSFRPSKPTAKSRMKPVIRSLPSWAICPVWSCSHGRPLPAGMCGATRWSRQRASGHGVQKSSGFGGTPTSISAARKLQVSIHLPCLPLTRSPGTPAKNGGSAVSYASSVPRFSMIALIIPSTSRSSLSLRELS